MSRMSATKENWRTSNFPKMDKLRISGLAKQKIQELPLEFGRYNQAKVTYKHFDKNKYSLAFSRLPVRSFWQDRDANHCEECHSTER